MTFTDQLLAIMANCDLDRDQKEAAMDRALRNELERELPVMPVETNTL